MNATASFISRADRSGLWSSLFSGLGIPDEALGSYTDLRAYIGGNLLADDVRDAVSELLAASNGDAPWRDTSKDQLQAAAESLVQASEQMQTAFSGWVQEGVPAVGAMSSVETQCGAVVASLQNIAQTAAGAGAPTIAVVLSYDGTQIDVSTVYQAVAAAGQAVSEERNKYDGKTGTFAGIDAVAGIAPQAAANAAAFVAE